MISTTFIFFAISEHYGVHGVVVAIKWSECQPFTTTIQVQIPLKGTVFPAQMLFVNNEYNHLKKISKHDQDTHEMSNEFVTTN